MAETVASFLVSQVSTLVLRERDLLGGTGDGAEYIRNELESMKALLRDAEAREASDGERVWVNEVRDVAYDAEDALAEFLIRFAHQDDEHIGCCGKLFSFIKNFRAYHDFANEIQSLRGRIREIAERHRRYQPHHTGNNNIGEAAASTSASTTNTGHDMIRDDALVVVETDLVGIEEPKEAAVELLLSENPELKVYAVFGMGGLGKTTLVRKVYQDARVMRHFAHHAWITVSESFNMDALLKKMIRQLLEEANQPAAPQELNNMDTDQLRAFLKGFLQGKRYVIVLDDVWNTTVWDAFRQVFPDNEKCRSRVMITSRLKEVALVACQETGGVPAPLKLLNREASWELFCKKAFPGGTCPSHLREISERILNRCQGLPLAIKAIGGALRSRDGNLEEWEKFQRSLGVELLEGDDILRSVTQLLSLSYNDLPYHLKLCFLYAGVFPEDKPIMKSTLIQLWIAEGFIEEQPGKTREEVAEGYFNKLVNRSLIMVAAKALDGTVISCRIHSILREIIVSKLKAQNIATIFSGRTAEMPSRIRRLAIHGSATTATAGTNTENHFSGLRSLILCDVNDSFSLQYLLEILGAARFVRVLDLRRAPLQFIPNAIFNLLHLKYLCLVETGIESIPETIGKLLNLQVLKLRETKVTVLPVQIQKLRRLRYLSVFKTTDHFPFGSTMGFKAQYQLGDLSEMQKLWFIEADDEAVREIGKLTKLRKLGIAKLTKQHGTNLCASIANLTDLRELVIILAEEEEAIDLQLSVSSSSILQFLKSFVFVGRLERMPEWISSAHSLTSVAMMWTRFADDPLQYLQDLPNLVNLALGNAYDGEQLHFRAGTFRKLKFLTIWKFMRLQGMTVEKGAMPSLENLIIADCPLMEEAPAGLKDLTMLEETVVNEMSDKFVTRLNNKTFVQRLLIYLVSSENLRRKVYGQDVS